MQIIFSQHALERIRERGISQEAVKNAIGFPDKIEKSRLFPFRLLIKKLYFNKKFKREHLLLIISEIKEDLIEIITIIDTSKISKYF